MHSTLAELKSRGVLKVATAYLALSWLVLEIGHTLFEIFDLPHLGLQFIFVVLTLGFPMTLAAAWHWRFASAAGTEHKAEGAHGSSATAIAFGAVALLAIAVAIGVRYFGFGHNAEHRDVGAGSAQVREEAQRTAPFSPPAHSVAVLSFVNMSGNAKDEYFSDGLSEELLHVLTRVSGLQVAARTSSFSFKGKNVDISTVARALNVGAVLEGSVRRAGDRVRITAQLINALNGFHLWSQTYDRDLRDIFALQSEIAAAVSQALEITLLADQRKTLAPGGTRNPQAFDAYLRGRYGESSQDEAGLRAAWAALDEAVTLDPNYAQALAFRADVVSQIANMDVSDAKERARLNADALASAKKAVALAPQSGLAFAALGTVLSNMTSDYHAIDAAYRRSVELEPGNAGVLLDYAGYAAQFGRADALTAARRAATLDPLKAGTHANLGIVLYYAHRHEEAAVAFQEAARLGNNRINVSWTGLNELAAGHAKSSLQYCERDPDFWYNQVCLAIAYRKLGRKEDAAAMLKKMMATQGDWGAYQYATIYANWGEMQTALKWLSRAVDLQDSGLLTIKADPFMKPLEEAPEFKAIVAKLDLPT